MKKQKKLALGLTGAFVACSMSSNIIPIENALAAKKSNLQLATDYTNYLASTLKNNYLGSSNLPLFNETLAEGKRYLARIPNNDEKRKLAASLSRSESIIRATEAVVKLEQSMARNSHTLKNVPTFEIYLNNASKRIAGLTHSEVQDAKNKLSERLYALFNDVRDIKVKDTSPYRYAFQLYIEGKMLYNIAKDNPLARNVKLADDRISDALNAVWKISVSRAKDKLRDDVKALLLLQSKLPGSTIPNGGGSGNGGTGNATTPQIILAGNVYMTIPLNEKYKEPGFGAIDDADGIITSKVKITYMNIATNEYVDTIPTDKSAVYQIAYIVTDSNKNQGIAYRFLAIGDAKIPGADGNGGGSTSSDKTPPVILLKGSEYVTVKIGDKFEDPKYEAYDLVDGNLTSQVKVTITNKVTGQTVTTIPTNAKGLFEIKYTVSDKAGNIATVYRFVQVDERGSNDGTNSNSPVITLTGNSTIYIKIGERFTEPGYTAKDSSGANITSSVRITITNRATGQTVTTIPTTAKGLFEIKYTVTDKNGLIGTVYRLVQVDETGGGSTDPNKDTIAPVITLNGEKDMSVKYLGAFVDPGVKITDNVDTNVPLIKVIRYNGAVVDRVDTTKPGTYIITYNATDKAGNKAQEVRRTVIVEDMNSSTNGALADITLEGSTIPITVDLVKANTVDGAEIKYVEGSNISGISARALSSNANVLIQGERGQSIVSNKFSANYAGNLTDNKLITITVTPLEGEDVKTYKIKLTSIPKNDYKAIADAILRAKTNGEIYKLLFGAFGGDTGIVNPNWISSYIPEKHDSRSPGLVIKPGTALNAVYGKSGQEIKFQAPIKDLDYTRLKDYVYAVNNNELVYLNGNSFDEHDQKNVTSAIDRYQDDDGGVKKKQVLYSRGKEYLFKMVNKLSTPEDIYGALNAYAKLGEEQKNNGLNFGIDIKEENKTEPKKGDLNEFLMEEYQEVLNESSGGIRDVLYEKIKKLGFDDRYPDIALDVVDRANKKGVTNTIGKLRGYAATSVINSEDTPKAIFDTLTALENKTRHRTDNYDNGKPWEFNMANEAEVDKADNYYFLDFNYKSYAEELKNVAEDKPHLVKVAIEKANEKAKDINKDILKKVTDNLASVGADITEVQVAAMVNSMKEMYDRLRNENTTTFNSYSEADKKIVAEKLIGILKGKGDLTIRKIIGPAKGFKSTSGEGLLKEAIEEYNKQVNNFKTLIGDITGYTYDENKKYDTQDPLVQTNINQWKEQRGKITLAINDYIAKVGKSLYNKKWIENYAGQEEVVAHYILYKYTDSNKATRDNLLNQLKNQTTVSGINSTMEKLITEAVKVVKSADILDGPNK